MSSSNTWVSTSPGPHLGGTCSDDCEIQTKTNWRSELQHLLQEMLVKELSSVGEKIQNDVRGELSGLRHTMLKDMLELKALIERLASHGSFAAENGTDASHKQGQRPPLGNKPQQSASVALKAATSDTAFKQAQPEALPGQVLHASDDIDEHFATNGSNSDGPSPSKTQRASRASRASRTSVSKFTPIKRGSAAQVAQSSLQLELMRTQKEEVSVKRLWDMSAAEILASNKFDNLVGALICLNAVTIGMQTEITAKAQVDTQPKEFHWIERVFLVCFTAELVLRLYVHRLNFIYTRWNLFDFVVVVSQLGEEVLMLISGAASAEGDTSGGLGNVKMMRILRVLRLMRVLRVMRVLRLISELRTIVSSIAGSMKSLMWTVVLLFLMMYMMGIFFTQSVTDHLVDLKTNEDDFSAKEHNDATVMQYHFGSLFRSILSLYQAMSGGVDWDAIADPLVRMNTLYGLCFVAYVAFALLAMMNVVTGVFVQEALKSAKDEEDQFLTEQMVNFFHAKKQDEQENFNSDQMIRAEDVASAVTNVKEWKSINISAPEAEFLFNQLDIDGTREVRFEEFLAGCLRIHGPSKAIDLLTLMQEFRRFSNSFTRWRTGMDSFMAEVREVREQVHKVDPPSGPPPVFNHINVRVKESCSYPMVS